MNSTIHHSPSDILNTDDLKRYVDHNSIDAELIQLPSPTPTVEMAAKAVGVSADQIAKTLIFTIRDEPIAVIASGLAPIDNRMIAKHCGVSRKRIKLADAKIVLTATGYPIGTVPPFGFDQQLPTLMDSAMLSMTEVYAGGGSINYLLCVSPLEIIRVTSAEVLSLRSANKENAR